MCSDTFRKVLFLSLNKLQYMKVKSKNERYNYLNE